MKKQIILTALLIVATSVSAQTGIGTTSPQTTLDVNGKPATATVPDGVIAPRITGDQLRAKNNAYTASHTGTIVYITAADTAPAGKTASVTTPGYYYYDGSVWQQLNDGNIYKNDGTLSANRTVDTDGKSLRFAGAGKIFADSEISSGFGGRGRASLMPGSTTYSGYLNVYKGDGTTRLGYIGFSNTDMAYVAENGSNHIFNGGNLGIATASPTSTLDVNGTGRVRSLPKGAGSTTIYPVFADANGNLVKASMNNVYESMNSNEVRVGSNVTTALISNLPTGIYKLLVEVGDGCTGGTVAEFYFCNRTFAGINGISGGAFYSRTTKTPNFNEINPTTTIVTWTNAGNCQDGGNSTQYNYTLTVSSRGSNVNITNNGNVERVYGATATRIRD